MSEERSQYEAQITAKVVISGTLVYHDKDGQEVGRADFNMAPPPEFFAPGVSFPDSTAGLADDEKAAIRAFALQCMSEEERAAATQAITEG
jgi:hypothetical protein